jgi:PPP family 3-phenylpropionic acid transporter
MEVTQTGAAAQRIEQATFWRLCGLSAALYVPYGLHLPYFPVWLAARGLSDFEIAASLATPLILRVLLMPLIAWIADRRGIASVLAFAACTMTAAYFGLNLASGFLLVFLGSVVAITAQGSMPALADALALAEMRRLQKLGQRRIQYGRIRVGASLSTLVMMLLSGVIVVAFPGQRIIVALALLAIVPAVATLLMARRMRRLRFDHSAKGGLTEEARALPLAIVVIVGSALIQASHAEIYAFGTLQWKAKGLAPEIISLAWAIGVMAESLLFIFGGRYVHDIRQALRLMLFGAAGAALRWLAMSFNPGAGLVLGLQLMHMLSFAATYMGSVLVLGWLAGPNHRARMQGWSSTAMALSMAVSTVICGRLTQIYGAGAYLAMVGLAAAGLGLVLIAMRLRRRLPIAV